MRYKNTKAFGLGLLGVYEIAVAALLVAMVVYIVAPAFARNGCTTSFDKGVQTTTCTKGSHASDTTQHGQGGGGGAFIGTTPCKQTDSTQTTTC